VTAYEAHKDAQQFRTKISQVFIYPHYQRQGLGSRIYERIIEHYLVEPKCYEVIVEDANDEFQRVQDIVNSKQMLKYYPRLNALLKSKNGFLHTDADVKEAMSISVPELV
jgi:GNAT superfamily N-acetyltransferase